MTDVERAKAVLDVLVEQVPDILKGKGPKQQARLRRTIAEVLVDTGKKSNMFKVNTTDFRSGLKDAADRIIGGEIGVVSRPHGEALVIMSKVDYKRLLQDLTRYRLNECRERGDSE
jgi:PHD/YefM family antitoxin component YafN of YafNO toxin-antitoxin module